jgi:REP element-mobilizing transposase RayT
VFLQLCSFSCVPSVALETRRTDCCGEYARKKLSPIEDADLMRTSSQLHLRESYLALSMKSGEVLVSANQLAFSFSGPKRGGARRGAGRKPRAAHLRQTPHRARQVHRKANPVHVTLRARLRSLRAQQVTHTLLAALRDSNRNRFRVVHYSVQENHVHLIVEAEDHDALLSGVRGLMVRVARRVNRLLFRRGRFWADRWHGRDLDGPRQVRNALVYVLQNRAKHVRGVSLDPLSSAGAFDGFASTLPRAFRSIGPPCVASAKTWLLRVGWRKWGLIGLTEGPAGGVSRDSNAAGVRCNQVNAM